MNGDSFKQSTRQKEMHLQEPEILPEKKSDNIQK